MAGVMTKAMETPFDLLPGAALVTSAEALRAARGRTP